MEIKLKKLSLVVVSAIALTGCVGMEITTPPVMVTPTFSSNAVGIDVYARDRSRGNPVPRFRGQLTVPVRTQGKTSDGSFGELAGIPCTVDAGVYKASFLSPTNLIVPNYGPNSPAIFVRCVINDLSGSKTVTAYNFSASQRASSAYGTGILGAIIIGAVAAAQLDDETDTFAYPPITVQVK